MPSLGYIRGVAKYGKAKDLTGDEESECVDTDLPGKNREPAKNVAQEFLCPGRSEFRYPVILATASWGLQSISNCRLNVQKDRIAFTSLTMDAISAMLRMVQKNATYTPR